MTYGVPEPVGGGRESDTTRTDWEREDLTNDDPGTRTPGGGEEEDEDGDEGNLGVDGRDVVGEGASWVGGGRGRVGVVETDSDTDNGDEELADQHTQGTPDEQRATTELLNGVEGDWSRANVHEGEDKGDQEGVADGTSRLQERSGVVEDEVDTSPLLHHLKRGTEDGAAQVGLLVPERTLEAVGPARDPARRWDDRALVLLVGNDLSELSLDVFGVLGLTTKAGEGSTSLLDAPTLDKVTWGVWEEEETTSEDQTPGELDTDGNAVSASVGAVLSSVGDASSEKQTDGDGELVTSDEGTTDLLWALWKRISDWNAGSFGVGVYSQSQTCTE